jgi:putative transposase
MARLPRYGVAGQPQHLIQRGNNRSPIFFSPEDYGFYIECLRDGCAKYDCAIHAYVLMTNHVHLLATPQAADGLSKLMQSVGRRYVQYINFGHQRSGTLWEGRYKATPIDTEGYLLTCYRYIEMNPVRAGMVKHPREYRWSSYRHHAEGRADSLIGEHRCYRALAKDESERRQAYRALFRAGLDDETLTVLRDSVNKGWALGNDRFRNEIAAAAQRRAMPASRGGRRKGAGRPVVRDGD